jgi:hypothetical protein
MKPREFKKRFRRAQPVVPRGIDFDPGAFRSYSRDRVNALSISDEAKSLLIEAGLPEEAPPFLSFFPGDDPAALAKLTEVDPLLSKRFSRYRVLGNNGSGDTLCIDERDGSVVYLNHDSNMRRVFINSSLGQFAEALCLMVEFLHQNTKMDFRAELSRIDPPALRSGTMWANEHKSSKKKT